MIKALRVDHRLLHGQVAFSWTSQLSADCILLASDTLLDNKIQLTTIKLAKPSGVKLVVKTIEDSIKAIESGVTDKYKLFIVVESIVDAAKLIRALQLKKLNLGGTKSAPEKKKLSKSIYVTEKEEQVIKELLDEGVDVQIQMVPSERAINVKNVL